MPERRIGLPGVAESRLIDTINDISLWQHYLVYSRLLAPHVQQDVARPLMAQDTGVLMEAKCCHSRVKSIASVDPHYCHFPPFVARAPWWGGDLQTLRGHFGGRRVMEQEHLYLHLSDGTGDRLIGALNRPSVPSQRPLVVLIHGVAGSENSANVVRTATHFLAAGYPVFRLNLRGAGRSHATCRFHYHAGRSEDLVDAFAALQVASPRAGIIAMGYSLGANVLLKFLGEHGNAAPLRAAVAVSAPLDLMASAQRVMHWRNAAYHRYMLAQVRTASTMPGGELTAAERQIIAQARSIWEFDDLITAPRNGFVGAEDYYKRNASGPFLDHIAVPTLIIHAADDPLVPSRPYSEYDWRRNQNLVPLLPRRGGHIGFLGRDRVAAWHDLCALQFLENALQKGVS